MENGDQRCRRAYLFITKRRVNPVITFANIDTAGLESQGYSWPGV